MKTKISNMDVEITDTMTSLEFMGGNPRSPDQLVYVAMDNEAAIEFAELILKTVKKPS